MCGYAQQVRGTGFVTVLMGVAIFQGDVSSSDLSPGFTRPHPCEWKPPRPAPSCSGTKKPETRLWLFRHTHPHCPPVAGPAGRHRDPSEVLL